MTTSVTTNLSCIYDIRDVKVGYDWQKDETRLQGEALKEILPILDSVKAESTRDHILTWLGQLDAKLTIIKDALYKQGFKHVHFTYNHRWNEDHTEILPHEDARGHDDQRKQYIIRDQIYEHLGTTTEMMIATTKYVAKFQKNAPKFRTIKISNDEYVFS